jgi:glycosyltransferase involved in cell wall biosynthesis
MRVLTVISELGVGGAEVVAVTLATAAAADGHEVLVASGPGRRIEQLGPAGVQHLPVPLVGRSPVDLARTVGRLRSIGHVDLVHAHNPKATLLARLAVGREVPIVTTLHGVSAAERARAARILRWASDRVVAVSPYVGDRLVRDGFPAARIEVVNNAVPPLAPYPRVQARAELGLADDAVVGLCLARMVDQKRHDLLVEAWSWIGERGVLLLAGDGPRHDEVVAAVARRGLDRSVRLLGERSDVPRLLAASDFLILPTDWEGLPISVLEAFSAGLPVVASRVAGLDEHFAGAVRFVEPGSVASLVEGLDEVLGSPAVRSELAARGRLAAERYGAAAMVARYREIYARLAGRPTGQLMGTGGIR